MSLIFALGGCELLIQLEDYEVSASSTTGSGGLGGMPSTSTSGNGGSGGASCIPVDDQNPCTDDVCGNGVPASKPVAAGTPCSMSGTQCDGMGNCVGCILPEDCPGVDDTCQARTCIQGKCGKDIAVPGTPCDDGNACTQTDGCEGGFCVGTNTVTCSALDQCHLAGACDPATGACSNPDRPDGDFCNDGDACTQTDTCQAGVCVGTNPVVCTQLDGCHAAGVCNPSNGVCSNPAQGDGFSCSDGDACTQVDACQGGMCIGGTPVVCTGGMNCVAGACVCTGVLGAPPIENAPYYGFGSGPSAAATADFNGDGKLDLAIVDNVFEDVFILLNQGNGTFGPPISFHSNSGNYPLALAAADFDGDGNLDFAFLYQLNAGVNVSLNQGNGTFAPGVDYHTSSHSASFEAADLNGDGGLDIVVASPGYGSDNGHISVLLNQGDGTFAARVDYLAGKYPDWVTTADLDGDGRPDLVVSNSGSGNVSMLLNQGGGTFGAAVNYSDFFGTIEVVDLNGDGKPDIVVSNFFSADLSVVWNQGDGTFSAAANYGTGSGEFAVADLDSDGKPDIVIANSGVKVLLNQGNSTFGATTGYVAGNSLGFLTVVDMNSDGAPDIVTADSGSNVRVLLNHGDGTFAPAIDYGIVWPTVVADMNADGRPDIVNACKFVDEDPFYFCAVSVVLTTCTP